MDQRNLVDLDSELDASGQRLAANESTPRSKNNSAPSEVSMDSEASSNEFVKFDENELAEISSSDFLSQFGSRVANDALESALENRPEYTTMDERDLYVPEGAGDAAAHPQPRTAANTHDSDFNVDEFDPLSSANKPHHYHHAEEKPKPLEEIPENKRLEQEEGALLSKIGGHRPDHHDDSGHGQADHGHGKVDDHKDDQDQHKNDQDQHKNDDHKKDDDHRDKPAKPTEPPTPTDNAGEESFERRHHAPLTHKEDAEPSSDLQKAPTCNSFACQRGGQSGHEHDYNEIAENIREAVEETHEKVENLVEDLKSSAHNSQERTSPSPPPHEDQNSPGSGDSGHDTLGDLTNLNEKDSLPASESVSSGMRDLSPELKTFEREGPLTIPNTAASGGAQHQQASAPAADDLDTYPGHEKPRPPTPPKSFDDDHPNKIDLGPPPPHSQLTHRSSEHGLRPILKHTGDVWVDFKSFPKPVKELLLWRNPRNSAIALAASLGALILVAKFTFISLLAWGSLLVLGGTVGFRVFKLVEAQLKKTDGTNPFKQYLEPEINLPQEKVHAQADAFVQHSQCLLNQGRRLFLVENLFDSIKFGVLLWTLTYIGAWFSGITLVTIFVLGLFSLPKVYELYQEPIDEYVHLARENVEKINHTIQDKIPLLKQRAAEKVDQAEKKVEKKEE